MATVATEPSPRARCSAEADVQFLQECLAKFVGSRGSRDVLNLLKDTFHILACMLLLIQNHQVAYALLLNRIHLEVNLAHT